jgi:hypothetical protein
MQEQAAGHNQICPSVYLLRSNNIQELRGGHSNGPFALDNGVLRLRQHGTVALFPQQCCT